MTDGYRIENPVIRALDAIQQDLADERRRAAETLRPCGCYADDPGCPPEHAEFNAKWVELAADRDVTHHEAAGCRIEELPYDPDLGDNEWRCVDHRITVRVPGWKDSGLSRGGDLSD